MLGKLLRKHVNNWQTAAYIAANLLGLLIIGIALQLHADLRPATGTDDPIYGDNFLMVSHVASGSLFSPKTEPFTSEEIQQLREQPWVTDVAPIMPSLFDASLGASFGGQGFSTALFFEGIPARVLDTPRDSWTFDPSSPEVSIIFPRDYLALYNFGFAPTRGLPTLDEQTLKMVPLVVTLSGHGRTVRIPARIVGFSSRISTIGAPEEFIKWANANFGSAAEAQPNRLIVSTAAIHRAKAGEYFRDHGISAGTSDGQSERMSHLVNIAAAIAIAIGAVICLLSVGLLLLSVNLLIQKSRPALSKLLFLGYRPAVLIRVYSRMVLVTNLSTFILTAACLIAGTQIWQPQLRDIGFSPASVVPTLLIIFALAILISLINYLQIRRLVRKIA